MMRMVFATVAALTGVFTGVTIAGVAFTPVPARAYEAPWCAVTSKGNGNAYWDCQYASIEQCQPHVVGGDRGWCNPNPGFIAGPADHRPPAKRRARPS
jgi:uncharacterized protein DUF3551